MRIITSKLAIIVLTLLAVAAGAVWLLAVPHSPGATPSAGPLSSAPVPVPPLPSIGVTTAVPTVIPVNTPTIVTVTSVIADPLLITTGINLLRLNPNRNPTIIAQLADNGTNGDAIAGDKTFTARVTFNEPATGQIQLQVSAAFRSLLRRVLSPQFRIEIWNNASDVALRYSLIYPPTLKTLTTTSGPVVEDTNAVAIVAFGNSFSFDGVPDTGLLLYVYPLALPESQSGAPGPPYQASDCQPVIIPSSWSGQICEQVIQADIVDSLIYRKRLTVTTGHYRYALLLNTESANDPAVTVFAQMVSQLRLY